MSNIATEVQIWKTLKERLALAYNLEDDDDALLQTLEGELPLTDIILQMAREAKQAEAYASALASIINDNQRRKHRLEEKAERLRALAAWAMGECGLTKLQEADVTISMRMGKPTLVIDADEPKYPKIPFTKVIFSYAWDKEGLRAAVERGDEDALAIAHMSNPKPQLVVRSK